MERKPSGKEREFIERAVALASASIREGGGPFGAVIVREGVIIAEAQNEVARSADPTAHAEILAIRKASRSAGTHNLSGCELYSSCEPCPMCLGAIYWAGIKRIYYAAGRDDAAFAGFNDAFIYDEISKLPEERKLEFIRVTNINGSAVFDEWKNYEGKIPY